MKKIIAFTGSNSPNSINQRLIEYIQQEFPDSGIEYLDLKDHELPIYSVEIEERGIPIQAKELFQLFASANAFILASPEHNGLPSAFLKNHIDWLSRIDQHFLGDKPILLLSASPGATGGSSHLGILATLVQRWGGVLTGLFSLGHFHQNFDIATNKPNKSKDEHQLRRLVNDLLKHQLPKGNHRTQAEIDALIANTISKFKRKGFL